MICGPSEKAQAVDPILSNTPVEGKGADDDSPTRTDLEEIGGYKVHPLASMFPLLQGQEFEDLVQGIERAGTVAPVEFNDGLLIDGRNRVRAVVALRERGVEIDLPTVEWQPVGDETVEEHIYSNNVHRRHLTDDQRVALATLFLPLIRQSREARQVATRFGQSGQSAVATISAPPDAKTAAPRRSSREKDANSSVGQLASLSNVSRHKAGQAIALADGVQSGQISRKEFDAVTTGKKLLRHVVPAKKRSAGKKTVVDKKRSPKTEPRPAAELMFENDTAASKDAGWADDGAVTEEDVRRRWDRLKQSYAVADHRELRALLAGIITAEQRLFDR